MDGYGTSYLAGSNCYNSKQRLELDEDAIFTKGPILVLGSGSCPLQHTQISHRGHPAPTQGTRERDLEGSGPWPVSPWHPRIRAEL
jgi:hypothetical protein